MPDTKGALTASDVKLVQDWIDKHRKNPACPVCASNGWQIGSYLTTPVVAVKSRDGYGLDLGGNLYPEVLCICNTCGFTYHFSGIVMGLVQEFNAPNTDADPVSESSVSKQGRG